MVAPKTVILENSVGNAFNAEIAEALRSQRKFEILPSG
jgi:hypothetical protein